jgi:hypothetical protein
MDWIDQTQHTDQCRALVNMVMNLRIPYNFGKFLNRCSQLAASQEGVQLVSFIPTVRKYTFNKLSICLLVCDF